MEKSDDALRTLFSGLSTDGLTAGDKVEIIAHVRERAARRSAWRENRFEWLMGMAALALLAAVAAAVWIFAPDRVAGIFAKIKLPEIDLPDTSFLHSPMLILVAACGVVLLIFDRLVRNRYNKKHLTEL